MQSIILYTAEALAAGGRANGVIRSADGVIDLTLRLPLEMGGVPCANATNPEQLFACAWAASFSEAIDFAAKERGRVLQGYSIMAKVTLGQLLNCGLFVTTEIEVKLPGISDQEAEEIVQGAKALCLYAKALETSACIEIRRG